MAGSLSALKPSSVPAVLLVNDDGPPSEHSPYVLSFYLALKRALGWKANVVLPSEQKSWGGMAYEIRKEIKGRWYYPEWVDDDGLRWREVEATETRRKRDDGEAGEWVLLDGTPCTCANVGLFNIYAGEKIDLVISGPNWGRNSSSVFALSSGTLGAALSASLSGVRSVAVSYAHFSKPPPNFSASSFPAPTSASKPGLAEGGVKKEESSGSVTKKEGDDEDGSNTATSAPKVDLQLVRKANDMAVEIIKNLWESWEDGVATYNINIPLLPSIVDDPQIYFTSVWRNEYQQLYKQSMDGRAPVAAGDLESSPPAGRGGGVAVQEEPSSGVATTKEEEEEEEEEEATTLSFTFGPPGMGCLVSPPVDSLPKGCDAWALANGWASVSRLRAEFGEVDEQWREGSGLGGAGGGGGGRGVGARWRLTV